MRTRASCIHAPRPMNTYGGKTKVEVEAQGLGSPNILLFSEPEFGDGSEELLPLIMIGSLDRGGMFKNEGSAPNSARVAEVEVKSIFGADNNTFAEDVNRVNLVEGLERDEYSPSFDFPDVGQSPAILPVRAENPMSNELLRNQLWKLTPPKEPRSTKLRSSSAPIHYGIDTSSTQIF
eukprot:TRINITY_DN12288_c0_g1_i1.p1 TRINITY_DN12288_c0_g1~~TRINITY_DN12288_c0_g1_i1.p1  ORF type:complete len:178 (-),score=33.18 TRINITY_DN12288_c0_g1_i1:180-713(-)